MQLLCYDGKYNGQYVSVDEPSEGDTVNIHESLAEGSPEGGETYIVVLQEDELVLHSISNNN